ncbi:MAG TPA: transposase domain-containing protein [Pseudonocardiaceae bacterium]|jgi:hypothetical protein|nr:transposase domain-containing protein [Pseudonocardiaceae bacterium]
MTQNAGVAAEGRWADQVSLGVLASSVARDVIDDVVASCGRGAKRSDGKLPPHVMVYFAMAMALFAEDDYEEVAARLAGTLGAWKCWDARWGPPTSGGITRARERLGCEPLRDIFAQVAVPVADPLTRGAFLGRWRLMAIDGFEWDAPDTPRNAAAFGYPGGGKDRAAFPKARVVSISECGSHAVVGAEIGGIAGKGAGEQSLARRTFPPDQQEHVLAALRANITRKQNLNLARRHRTYPRVVKRARHNSYRVKRAGDRGICHAGPPVIKLANLGRLSLAA